MQNYQNLISLYKKNLYLYQMQTSQKIKHAKSQQIQIILVYKNYLMCTNQEHWSKNLLLDKIYAIPIH